MATAPKPMPPMGRYECQCQWVRTWNENAKGYVPFIHPLYGQVTGKRAAELDISNHDCVAYGYAVSRIRQVMRGAAEAAA